MIEYYNSSKVELNGLFDDHVKSILHGLLRGFLPTKKF